MNAPKSKNRLQHDDLIQKAIMNTEAEGFFGPHSMHWKLYREPGIMVAGISALLLQIAHPAVAIGVHRYSQFKKDFLGRAHRTVVSMTKIWLGSKTDALQSSQRLYHIHSHIKGVIKENKNGEMIDRPFCANDPDLLCWVLATMTMATVEAYGKVYRPLTQKECDLYYEETKITAQLMGIPLEEYPPNWEAFKIYYQRILASDELEVGNRSLELAEDIFKAYFPFSNLMRVMAAGFLTPKLNEKFGLAFTEKEQKRFGWAIRFFSLLMKIIPNRLRYGSQFHRALYRIAREAGKRPKKLERWHTWLGKNIKLPFLYEGLKTKT